MTEMDDELGIEDLKDELEIANGDESLAEETGELSLDSSEGLDEGEALGESCEDSEPAEDSGSDLGEDQETVADTQSRGLVLVLETAAGDGRQDIKGYLEESGYDVIVYDNIPEAIENIVTHPPRVLLHSWTSTDFKEGCKLHRKLNSDQKYDGIARIILSEKVSPQLIAMAHDYGIDRVLPDTVVEDELLQIISWCCEIRDEEVTLSGVFGRSSDPASAYVQSDLDEKVCSAYRDFPHLPRVQIEYGSYLIRSCNWDEAEDFSKELVARNPDDVRAMNLLARVYMKQKRFTRAIDVLRKAHSISPDNPERLVMIGDALYEKGELGDAKASYEGALEIEPDMGQAQNGLGMVHVALGELDTALSYFKKCLSEDETASFFNNAAVLAVKSKKTTEALRLYEIALKGLQTEKYAHIIFFNIGLAFYRIDEKDQAIQALQASLKYNPSYEKSKRLLERLMDLAAS